MTELFFHLVPTARDNAELDPGVVRALRQKEACASCGNYPAAHVLDGFELVYMSGVDMQCVSGMDAWVVSERFFDQIRRIANAADLSFASVLVPKGMNGKFVLLSAAKQIVIRGDATSTFRQCDVCGRNLYYPFGKHCLFGLPDPRASLYRSQLATLVLPISAYAKIGAVVKGYQKVVARKLPTMVTPTDGRGEIPLRHIGPVRPL